ncbi:TetR/AcrR family transcriptional regulator [Nocardioides caldifontis]|uniref:TetR/AcrR family transcriptional regulator n=1 Tax=Nocardioides caldifontis TaxID=2588938 RepID=UPI0011DFA1A5|nr:TetR/AcrR family transcriptional regulator [Nocardioides caldifontis]
MPPPPQPLSRAAIIDAAIQHVDENGLAALTMRTLGQRLGVEAMSLYHHVNGREDLLEGMVDHLVSQVQVPDSGPDDPGNGWQAVLQHVAHDVRGVATAHPFLFPLVATRPPAAPWLRPPLRSLALVEEFLAALVERGLGGDLAVHVYKVFTSFLLGHLLLEAAQMGATTSPPSEPLDEGDAEVPADDARQQLADYPTLLRLEGPLRRHDADAQFERALEALLDRLDLELAQ